MPFPTITTTQEFDITPNITNRVGQTAPVDGPVVYASSNEAVALVVPSADGMSATVKGQGVGDYTVSVSADADLGTGVVTIAAQDDGSVTIGQASSIGFTVGAVREQA